MRRLVLVTWTFPGGVIPVACGHKPFRAASRCCAPADDRRSRSDQARPARIGDARTRSGQARSIRRAAPAQDKPAPDPRARPGSGQARSRSGDAAAGQEKPAPVQETAAGAQEKPAPPDAAASQPPAAPAEETPHEPVRSDVASIPVRRPRDQYRRRSGSIPALPGRAGWRELHRCAGTRAESPEGDWLLRAAADNVGYRDQRYFADYQRTGRFKCHRPLGRDPAVLQCRHRDRLHPHRRQPGAGRCDAAAIQNGQGTCRPGSRSRRSSSSTNAATSARRASWPRRSRSSI